MGDSLKEFSLNASSEGGGNNSSVRSETFGNIQRFVFVSGVQCQLSDKSLFIYIFLIASHFPQIGFVPSVASALSITDDRRDLVPFGTTTSYPQLKIHNANVAAGDFGGCRS